MVDSVAVEAIGDATITAAKLDTLGATPGQLLILNDTTGLGWAFVNGKSVRDRSLSVVKISTEGGGTGQILTVRADTAVWLDAEEISGAALPDKSVRAIKLNSEDGTVGQVMLAADLDSVVWGQIGSEGLSNSAVTVAKMSSVDATQGQVVMAVGDSVAWADIPEPAEAAIRSGMLSSEGASGGEVLIASSGVDTLVFGKIAGESVAPAAISTTHISTQGGSVGDVLAVAIGDTTAWQSLSIGSSEIQNGAVTLPKISVAGGQVGNALLVTNEGADWGAVDPNTFAPNSIDLLKLGVAGASAGTFIGFSGGNAVWLPQPALALPFSGASAPADSTSFKVINTSSGIEEAFGVHAIMEQTTGAALAAAVYAENKSTTGQGIGLWGEHKGLGWAVYGTTPQGRAIYGSSIDGWAGFFNGRVKIVGTLEKSAGSFKIDHPLDPENKYLSHSFVESPDMMNIYNGIVILDADGQATIELPDWFDALNNDFRYQLTAIGGPGPDLYIATEVVDNTFAIAGGSGGMKVSWQVTGIRDDAYARNFRIPVEEDKPAGERGSYLHPEVFGLGAERSLEARTDQANARQ